MNLFLACQLNLKGIPSCRKPFLWLIKFLHLFHDQSPPSASRNILFWEFADWLPSTSTSRKLDSVPLKIASGKYIASLPISASNLCLPFRLWFLHSLGQPRATFLCKAETDKICLSRQCWGIHFEVIFVFFFTSHLLICLNFCSFPGWVPPSLPVSFLCPLHGYHSSRWWKRIILTLLFFVHYGVSSSIKQKHKHLKDYDHEQHNNLSTAWGQCLVLNPLGPEGLSEGHFLPQGKLSLQPTQILCQWEFYNLFCSILMIPLKILPAVQRCIWMIWTDKVSNPFVSFISEGNLTLKLTRNSRFGPRSNFRGWVVKNSSGLLWANSVLNFNSKVALELGGLQRFLCWVQRLGFNLWNLASVNIPKAGIELSNY